MLQHVAVPVIENPVCESWHKTKGIDIRIYDEMMCAGYEIGQRDACQVSISVFRGEEEEEVVGSTLEQQAKTLIATCHTDILIISSIMLE